MELNILRVKVTNSQTQMPDCFWMMSWFIWPNRCLDWVDATCAICELQIVSSRILWWTHHAGLYLSHQPLLMCVWKKEAVFRHAVDALINVAETKTHWRNCLHVWLSLFSLQTRKYSTVTTTVTRKKVARCLVFVSKIKSIKLQICSGSV